MLRSGQGLSSSSCAAIDGLQPAALWSFFSRLSSIPRPSKHEHQVMDWIKQFAASRGLDWTQDAVGNLVVRRPGTGGGEGAPPVIVQGHVDMVTEKNAGSSHNFFQDPITLVRDGDWLRANGTTLGADNGIGVATALALLDIDPSSGIKLPPLEALFTVDEETGLTGAFGLDGSMLSGRVLLNLDTEEWPEIFIGCAGGGDSVLTLNLPTEKVLNAKHIPILSLELTVSGLKGGHSGLEIHEDRCNAVRLAAQATDEVLRSCPAARLVTITGGDKRNAIPRECRSVLVLVPENDAQDDAEELKSMVASVIARVEADAKAEYGSLETGLTVKCEFFDGFSDEEFLSQDSAHRLVTLLLGLPHGVLKYSHSVPGLVETSSNLASVINDSCGELCKSFRIQCSTRSSLMPSLERSRQVIRRFGELCGATVEQGPAYPGWQPDPSAPIVSIARVAISSIAGREPEIKAIHAGLECGILGEKLPGCQSVSFGPTIKNAHSPEECVQISTVQPFWEATLLILQRLADQR
jgi:dipeptidase D